MKTLILAAILAISSTAQADAYFDGGILTNIEQPGFTLIVADSEIDYSYTPAPSCNLLAALVADGIENMAAQVEAEAALTDCTN